MIQDEPIDDMYLPMDASPSFYGFPSNTMNTVIAANNTSKMFIDGADVTSNNSVLSMPSQVTSLAMYYNLSLFDILPDELLLSIFSFLHGREVSKLVRLVNRRWYELGSDDHLWYALVRISHEFTVEEYRNKPASKTWKWLYMSRKNILRKSSDEDKLPEHILVARVETKDWVYEGDWLASKEHGYGKKIWRENLSQMDPAAATAAATTTTAATTVNTTTPSTGPNSPSNNDTAIVVASSSLTVQPWERCSHNYYIGQWLEGKEHGIGKRSFEEGHYYLGDWKQGERDGSGEYHWPNGTFYIGEFKSGFRHGEGAYTWGPNSRYVGHWERGIENGRGIRVWSDGDIYEGDWVQGSRTGYGVYKWPNGSSYEGEWARCAHEGQGVYQWPDGREYRGAFRNNKKEGFGVYQWPDGSVYEGEWIEGVRHGSGKMKWSDGPSFQGQWNRDSRGRGEYRDSKGAFVPFDDGSNWSKKYDRYFDMPTAQWEALHLPEINRLIAERRKRAKQIAKANGKQ
jgi:hypothetical protein